MPVIIKLLVASLIAAPFLHAGVVSWANVAGEPHDLSLDNSKGHCTNCHDLHQPKLGQGYVHNLKRANEKEVCYQCHAGALNNYSSIDRSFTNITGLYSRRDIKAEFGQAHTHFPRYGMDGEHNKCSHCHNPHGVFDPASTTRRPKLLSSGPDAVTDTDEYCFVCHNNDPNPPHAKFPNISVGTRYRFSRDTYNQMTHSTFFRATTMDEPFPDAEPTYDDNPYGAGKDISCLTCHRPHGSPYDHILKSADNQDFCLGCHNGSKAESLTSFTTSGHGKPGVRRICQECHFPHGTGQENAVKKDITDPHTLKNMTADVSVRGMNEACFACHGQSSANRYYPGKAGYSAGIHKTSPNAHNPGDEAVPPDQAPGDCGNCHDPHGDGISKMLRDPGETLCYDCHNAATPNTRSGEDVKAAFQQLSSHHDLSKVSCVNCHNVHMTNRSTTVMMDPFKPQSSTGNYRVFCPKCHSGGTPPPGVTGPPNMDTEWAGGGHNRNQKLLCSDCHESHGSANRSNLINYNFRTYSSKTAGFTRGMSFAARAFCEACHNRAGTGYKRATKIPTGALYVGQHEASDTTPCSDCHAQKHNPTLGGVYYTNACLNCHKQGVGNPYPAPDADFNTPTVSGDLNTYTSIHNITYSPPATSDCAKCHGSSHETDHRTTNKLKDPDPANGQTNMSSIRVNNYFCLECHDSTPVSVGGYSPSNTNSVWTNGGHDKTHAMLCSDCHQGHRSYNRYLLNYAPVVKNYTAKFGLGLNPDSRAFCELCHNRTRLGFRGKAKVIPTGALYVSQHDQSDATVCGSCHSRKHNPTLTSTTGVVGYYNKKCLDCHRQGVGNPYPAPDADFNTPTVSGDLDTYTSIHNITYNPSGAVDCRKCHGSNHETDHRTTNKLKDPDTANGQTNMSSIRVNNYFCLECHDSTPVSIGGSTPSNINSVWTNGGHDKTHAMLCSDCHQGHRSYNKYLMNYSPVVKNYTAKFGPGLNTNSRAFCELCHNRTRLGFRGKAKVIPTGALYVSQHDQSDTTPCGSCHTKKHNPTLGSYTGSSTYYTNACLNCHRQGVGNPYPAPDADFDTPTNPGDPKTKGSVHDITYSPPATSDCTKCHGSNHETDHRTTNKIKDPDTANGLTNMSSIRRNNNFCLECHDSTPVTLGGFTPVNILNAYTAAGHGSAGGGRQLCTVCHEHHGSVNVKLIKANISGIAIMSTYSGNNVSVCISCHRKANRRQPQWSGYSVYSGSIHAFGNPTTGNLVTDGAHGPGVCVNCHNPHGARQDGKLTHNMTLNEGEALCYNCHNTATPNTASGEDVQGRFLMLSRHNISDADQLGPDGIPGTSDDSKIECENCHDPHTITVREMAFDNLSDITGKKAVPVAADQAFCIKCHDGSPPPGVKYPATGTWDKSQYLNSAHGNHLKRNRTLQQGQVFLNYSNGKTYACKVCHHPHGSNQAYLQRDNFDINRDGLPDDIDEDGVLDSTDMVGFIGYSTGTRRPILVNTTAGIPSRSGFQRVSSTIPYQGNGTIDIELCLNCHDGTPAYDVESDIKKRSHHPVEYVQQQAMGGARIYCYSCHDQHRAQATDYGKGEYATTNPESNADNPLSNREPMPGDASFCLKCHDNTLPAGVSFGSLQLKNIKLSYNPTGRTDANGYDLLTSHRGHFEQSTGEPMMCRYCHNQHGSEYTSMLRDNTESGKPNHDPLQPIQEMQPVALRQDDPMGGLDILPVTSETEHCLACHSGVTTFRSNLIPLPPPPDADARGFSLPPVAKHPDLKPEVTVSDEVNGHIYKNTFALVTTPGSVKENCTSCHDSHNPYIATNGGQLMDCYQCHNMNTSLPDTQSEFNDNPTDPGYSASIHPVKYDPTGATPSYVECLKCHDQSEHMEGTVRLRKDPSRFDNYTSEAGVWADPIANRTINQFCLECHAPDTAVASSFWRGGTEHVPPKLPFGHRSSAHYVNGNLLCSDCHDYHGSRNNLGLKKSALAGEEEAFCYNCHSDPAKSQNGVNVRAKFDGTASHHKVSQADQSAKGSKVECGDCHNPHTVTRENPVVSASDKSTPVASDTAFCIGCHDGNGAKGVKFPGFATGTSALEWNPATGAWNKWNKKGYLSYSSTHGREGVACQECHDPHGSSNYGLLLTNISGSAGISVKYGIHSTVRGKRTEEVGVNSLCAACHKGAMGVYGGYAGYTGQTFGRKRGIDKNCTYCHNVHGSGESGMIRSGKPLYMSMTSSRFGGVYNFRAAGGFDNPTTGSPYYSFCSSRNCHKGTGNEGSQFDAFNMNYQNESGGLTVDNFSKDETVVSHHPVREGVITCLSCHKEHGTSGTNNVPDLRADYYRQGNWPALWHTSGSGQYPAAAYLHGAYYWQKPPKTSTFDGRNYFDYYASGGTPTNRRSAVITPSTPGWANDLCFMCHQKEDIIGAASGGMTGANTNFKGHEAVAGGATMSVNISKKQDKLGTDYHNFSCSLCHYAHASRKGKLLRRSCMSQYKGDSEFNYRNGYYAPPSGYGVFGYGGVVDIFNCHSFRTKTGTYWNTPGWRDVLMSPAKTDFKRPPNPVTDLELAEADTVQITVKLKWTPVTDYGGAAIHHYNVYRYSQEILPANKQYAARISNKGVGGAFGSEDGKETFFDNTCQPNATYWYAVVACDAENNESLLSNSVGAAFGADTAGPAAVTQTLAQSTPGSRNILISWHDPGDNINVMQYRVYRKDGCSSLTFADITSVNLKGTYPDTSQSADGSADTNTYTHTDSTVDIGTSYSYAVMAYDAAYNRSPLPTGDYCITVDDPAPAAVSLTSAVPVPSQMKASLAWTAPANDGGIQGYHVYRKEGSALTQPDLVPSFRIMSSVAGASATDDNVPSTGVNYYYTVTAIDQSSGKESPLGNNLSVNIPAPPSNLTASKSANSVVRLNWQAPAVTTNLSTYKIYYSRDAGSWTPIEDTTNLFSYGTFDTDLSGWTASGLTAAQDTGVFHGGSASVRLDAATAGDHYYQGNQIYIGYSSATYKLSAWVYIPVELSGGNATLRVKEYKWVFGTGYVQTADHSYSPGVTLTSGWQKIDYYFTRASSDTYYISPLLQVNGAGTVYFDDIAITNPYASNTATSRTNNLSGQEPGSYEYMVSSYYSTYGGAAPYESLMSSTAAVNITDTAAPETFSITGGLTQESGYDSARLDWSAPADLNYAGYTPAGLHYYRVESSSNGGVSWKTLIKSRLTNPGLETFSGTVDDSYTDTFSGWTVSNTSAYAVSDCLFDSRAMKIKYTGTGDRSIYSAEPDTGAPIADKQYSVSFWAKANKDATFQYYLQENGGGLETTGAASPTIGNSWQRFTAAGTFSSGATATSARIVIIPPADTTAEVTIDAVRLGQGADDATVGNDGSFWQPGGYGAPGSPQSFDDWNVISPNTSVKYRVSAADAQHNFRTAGDYTVYGKPTAVDDVSAIPSPTASENAVTFTRPFTLAGVANYTVYAKQQAEPFTNLSGATIIGTPTPATSGGRVSATAAASVNSSLAPNVLDGNTGTYWYGTTNTVPQTVTLTFAAATKISKVSFTFYSSGLACKDFLIQTWDGSGWVTQRTVTGNASESVSYSFPAVTTTQLRMYITETVGGITVSPPYIKGIYVYPCETFVHDVDNAALPALPGITYSYAVTTSDVNGAVSDVSTGTTIWATVPDKDPPAKVGTLALSSPVDTDQVVLTWQTPLDNDGNGAGTGAAYYEIYRLPTVSDGTPEAVTDGNYTTASLVASGTYASSTAGTDNSYTATWYDHRVVYYAVRSADSAGNWSDISNSPWVIVGKDMVPPTAPEITECRPVTSPEVDVYWNPATDNVEVNGYRLFRADSNAEPFLSAGCIDENNIGQADIALNLISYDAISAADMGGTPGTTYFYALKAWDNEFNMSNISNCGIATVRTTDIDTEEPTWSGTPLDAFTGDYPDIDLVWTPASDGAGTIDHYDIYRSESSFAATTDPGVSKIATVAGVRTWHIDSDTGKTGNTAYYYGIVAADASANHNESALSNVISATVAPEPCTDSGANMPAVNNQPTVPTILAAATGVYPYINLSWTASADVDDCNEPQPLNYYKLYRSDGAGITEENKNNAEIVTTFIMPNDASGYAMRGIDNETYKFRLEAFDLAGNASGLSNQVTGQVAPAPCVDETPPYAPAGLTGAVGPSPDINLAWTASTDNGGGCSSQIDHYLLYRENYEITGSTDLSSLHTAKYVAGNSTTYTDSSGAPNTQYWYVMTAVDSSGNESDKSNIITRMTAADTMAPAAIADLKADALSGKIQLTWCKPSDNVGVHHYEIYRKEQSTILQDADIIDENRINASVVNTGVCLTSDDNTVQSGHTYSYAVIAVDAAGNRSTISRGRQSGDTIATMP